jgi:membrane protease YdiL (CAAX protease family)
MVMRRSPVAAYFILACAISWLAVSPLILHADVSPSWHAFGALGPLIAALVVTASVGGRQGLRDFGRRLVRWRVGTIAWVLALSPIALAAIAIASLAVMGAPLNGTAALRDAFADPAWVGGMFLASLAYGIGEESGWRGHALPYLEQTRTAFRATVLLSIGWGIWHVPYFFYRYHLGGVGEYIGFYLGLFAGAVWLTFLYNSTGGSTLIVVVWHTVWNAVALVATVISPQAVALTSALIMLSALIAFRVGGPQRLSWSFRQRFPTPVAISP